VSGASYCLQLGGCVNKFLLGENKVHNSGQCQLIKFVSSISCPLCIIGQSFQQRQGKVALHHDVVESVDIQRVTWAQRVGKVVPKVREQTIRWDIVYGEAKEFHFEHKQGLCVKSKIVIFDIVILFDRDEEILDCGLAT